MAERYCFIATPTERQIFKEELIEFEFFNGFSITQKRKSILSFHNSIKAYDSSLKILEVSTKSPNPLGVQLSAFNLKFHDSISNMQYYIENIFQSSKIFENGGPYNDLLYVSPKEAKRDERLKISGSLIKFNYNNKDWAINPKTMFYDWIYINSLYQDKELSKEVLRYNAFTDIEFNHKKSINCQARSASIFVSLSKKGIFENYIKGLIEPSEIYEESIGQISFF